MCSIKKGVVVGRGRRANCGQQADQTKDGGDYASAAGHAAATPARRDRSARAAARSASGSASSGGACAALFVEPRQTLGGRPMMEFGLSQEVIGKFAMILAARGQAKAATGPDTRTPAPTRRASAPPPDAPATVPAASRLQCGAAAPIRADEAWPRRTAQRPPSQSARTRADFPDRELQSGLRPDWADGRGRGDELNFDHDRSGRGANPGWRSDRRTAPDADPRTRHPAPPAYGCGQGS